MHCFHGSDAHRLALDPKNPKRLGIGDRASEFLLDDAAFEAIVAVLRSKQFDRTRPFYPKDQPFDSLAAAREEGPSLVQSFHESANQRGGKLTAILNDICAFANTAGGTVYIGASPRKTKPQGLPEPGEVQQSILSALDERLTPTLEVKSDILDQWKGVKVIRIQVPKGPDRPYCLDDYKYYVRDESDTTLAVRDELVALVKRNSWNRPRGPAVTGALAVAVATVTVAAAGVASRRHPPAPHHPNGGDNGNAEVALADAGTDDAFYLPQIGVEIVNSEKRNNNVYHSIRDLRNGHVIHNVTRKGARKLWNYAIQQHEDQQLSAKDVTWQGDVGLVHAEKRAGKLRYDLALRENGSIRIFYGVTEDGMEGRWATFVQDE